MPTISIKLSFLFVLIFTILSVVLFSTPLHSFGPTGRAGTTLSCGSDEVLTATSTGLECIEQGGLDALTGIDITCEFGIGILKWDSQAGGGQGGIVSDCISFLIFDDVITAGDLPATDCPAGQVLTYVTEEIPDSQIPPNIITTNSWECRGANIPSNVPTCSGKNQFLQLTETGFACFRLALGAAEETLSATLNQIMDDSFTSLDVLEDTDLFGTSISISADGNTLVVGADEDDGSGTNRGAAYIFIRSGNTWTLQETLDDSFTGLDVLEDNDVFGTSISISTDGNILVVGAPLDEGSGTNRGAVYIFIRSGNIWTLQETLDDSFTGLDVLENSDHFGRSTSLSTDGNILVVGAPLDDGSGTNRGATYIFTRSGNTWTLQKTLDDSFTGLDVLKNNDWLGRSTSISADGNTLVVGAPLDDGSGTDRGATYIFTRSGNTWTLQETLDDSFIGLDVLENNDSFGGSTSLSSDGNTLVVRADEDDGSGIDRGAAYIFIRSGNTWTLQETLDDSFTGLDVLEDNDVFGTSISLSSDGNTLVVGANGDYGSGADRGAAYIFIRSGNTWTLQETLDDSFIGLDILENSDWFGTSTSLSTDGNILVVGANGDYGSGIYRGAVYVFDLNYVSLPSVSTQRVSPPPATPTPPIN